MSWLSDVVDKSGAGDVFPGLDPQRYWDQWTGVASAREANKMSQASSREQMAFQSAEADKARAWEADLANSAYQRQVKDLKKAGLNPVLGVDAGGAPVPSVAAPSGSSFSAQNTMPGGYGAQFMRALELLSMVTGISKDSATAANTRTQTELMKKNLPKAETFEGMWDVILPFSTNVRHSAKDYFSPGGRERDFLKFLGLGQYDLGPKTRRYLQEKNVFQAR